MSTADTGLYRRDFYEWSRTTAQLLRQRRLDEVDVEGLAEEIEDMGKSEKHAVQSLLARILEHLLKIGYANPSPAVDEAIPGWEDDVDEFRRQLESKLEDSPSLKRIVPEEIPRSYRHARRRLLRHRMAQAEEVPELCPFSAEDILNEDYFPPSRSRES